MPLNEAPSCGEKAESALAFYNQVSVGLTQYSEAGKRKRQQPQQQLQNCKWQLCHIPHFFHSRRDRLWIRERTHSDLHSAKVRSSHEKVFLFNQKSTHKNFPSVRCEILAEVTAHCGWITGMDLASSNGLVITASEDGFVRVSDNLSTAPFPGLSRRRN